MNKLDQEPKAEIRRVWVRPEFKRIEAGSAEAGAPNQLPDGQTDAFRS